MNRILIIGSEGQLGTELSSFLSKKFSSENIVISDIKNESSSSLTYKRIDALSYDDIENVVKKYEIDEIYHLAAILSAKGEEDPSMTWKINMNSLFNVLEIAKKKLVKKVFWPSSISVFGDNTPKKNTDQFSIKEPKTVYGISKLAGERWCEYYNNNFQTDIRSIRFPGIISSNTLPGGGTTDYAVSIFYSLFKNEEFNCFLKKDTMLPMIYIDDAIRSIYELMSVDLNDLRIKSSYNLSAFSFSPEMIFKALLKFNPNFKINYSPDFRQGIADSWPNNIDDLYAREDWSWKPNFFLKETVEVMTDKIKINNGDI